MQKATIEYRGADLSASEQAGRWTVQLGALEASSRYLDLALAGVLENQEVVHELAARLLAQLPSGKSVGAEDTVAA